MKGDDMKTKTFRTDSGFYAIMVWDDVRNDWSLWWSGSKDCADMERELAVLAKYDRKEAKA
jgi:hypothetical protein